MRNQSILPALGVLALWSTVASARLGGDAASVLADGAALQATVRTTPLQSYDVQQLDVAGGLSVREFVGRDGTVFGLSWTGPVAPNLQLLLGGYFGEFTTAAAALEHPGLQRTLRVALPDLVVESGGHLRAYAGRAYLPARLPAGLNLAELR